MTSSAPPASTPQREMHTALQTQNWPRVLSLARAHGDEVLSVFVHERGGSAPLHSAAFAGPPALVEALLDCGADVNQRRYGGASALALAAMGEQPQVLKLLCARGAVVDAIAPANFWTPLMEASARGSLRCAKALINRGADVNYITPCKGQMALEQAAFYGHHALCKLLLSKGAIVDNLRNASGNTALIYATDSGHVQVVKLLLAHGARVAHTNGERQSAVDCALRRGFFDVYEVLIRWDAEGKRSERHSARVMGRPLEIVKGLSVGRLSVA